MVHWIEVNLNNQNKIYVGVLYKQPEMFREITAYHQQKTKNNPDSIVMFGGDFNAGHIDWEHYIINTNADNRAVHEKLLEIITDNELN